MLLCAQLSENDQKRVDSNDGFSSCRLVTYKNLPIVSSDGSQDLAEHEDSFPTRFRLLALLCSQAIGR